MVTRSPVSLTSMIATTMCRQSAMAFGSSRLRSHASLLECHLSQAIAHPCTSAAWADSFAQFCPTRQSVLLRNKSWKGLEPSWRIATTKEVVCSKIATRIPVAILHESYSNPQRPKPEKRAQVVIAVASHRNTTTSFSTLISSFNYQHLETFYSYYGSSDRTQQSGQR